MQSLTEIRGDEGEGSSHNCDVECLDGEGQEKPCNQLPSVYPRGSFFVLALLARANLSSGCLGLAHSQLLWALVLELRSSCKVRYVCGHAKSVEADISPVIAQLDLLRKFFLCKARARGTGSSLGLDVFIQQIRHGRSGRNQFRTKQVKYSSHHTLER